MSGISSAEYFDSVCRTDFEFIAQLGADRRRYRAVSSFTVPFLLFALECGIFLASFWRVLLSFFLRLPSFRVFEGSISDCPSSWT